MNRKELKQCLQYEKCCTYGDFSVKHRIFLWLTDHGARERYKYIKCMRKAAYCEEAFRKGRIIFTIPMLFWLWRRNTIGNKLGFEIYGGNIEKGLTLHHSGSIVINREAKIGENLQLHGSNCIGNKGNDKGVPIIGNNVDIGFGASVFGSVRIADNVKIGGAVVVTDCPISGGTYVGVPAKLVK